MSENAGMVESRDESRTTVLDLVAAAKDRVEEIGVEQLRSEIAQKAVTVLDIRDVRERWSLGAIPGSVSVPSGMLEFWVDPESPYYREGFDFTARYVVHCAGGMRSALAAETMGRLGFTNVAHLEPGFAGWVEADGEVEQITPNPKYFRRD